MPENQPSRDPKPDLSVKRFRSQAAWAAWLERQHGKTPGVWLEFAKKSSGLARPGRAG